MRPLIFLLALLVSSRASVVWVESGVRITGSAAVQILPTENRPDFRFTLVNGVWSLTSLPEAGHGSMLAYAGMLAIILPSYATLPGSNWAHTATLFGWWQPDGVAQWIGLLPNPANDDVEANRYHALMLLSWNADNSLTIQRWGYETVPGVPIVVPVPEAGPAMIFMLFVALMLLKRNRNQTPQ